MNNRLATADLGSVIFENPIFRMYKLRGEQQTPLVACVLRPSLFRRVEDVWVAIEHIESIPRVFHPAVLQVVRTGHIELPEGDVPYFLAPDLCQFKLSSRLSRIVQAPMHAKLDVLIQVTEGLAELHDAGVLHGNLSPDEIYVDDQTRPLIAGYGLSFLLEHPLTAASDGVTQGLRPIRSIRYAAPEQLCVGAPIDSRADMFALGLILCEIVSGRHPFDSISPSIQIQARLHEPQAGIRFGSSELATRLSAIARALVHPDPSRRPSTLLSVLKQLYELKKHNKELARSIQSGDECATDELPLGREGAFSTMLRVALAPTPANAPLVEVRGDSGMGKTYLLDALQRSLRSRGRKVVYCVFDDLGRQDMLQALRRGMHGSGIDVEGASDFVGHMHALQRASGVTIVVDDAQWAPPHSIRTLHKLLRRHGPRNACLVVARRGEGDDGAQGGDAMKDLTSADGPISIPLLPWSSSTSLRFLQRHCRSRETARILLRAFLRSTRGIPLLAVHWLQDLISEGVVRSNEDGNFRVDSLVELERHVSSTSGDDDGWILRRIVPKHRAMLDVAACDGMDWDVDIVAQAIGVPVDDVHDALADLRREGIVTCVEDEVYRFAHYRLRDAVVSELPSHAKTSIHLALAGLYSDRHSRQGDTGAMAKTQSLEHCLTAGSRAIDQNDVLPAAHYLMGSQQGRRALMLLDASLSMSNLLTGRVRVEAMLFQADVYQFLGQLNDLPQRQLQAAEVARGIPARDLEAVSIQRAFCGQMVKLKYEALHPFAKRVMKTARDSHVDRIECGALLALTRSDQLLGNPRGAVKRAAQVLRRSDQRIGNDLRLSARVQMMESLSYMGAAHQAACLAPEAIDAACQWQEPTWEVILRNQLATNLSTLGRTREAIHQIARSALACERCGWHTARSAIATARASALAVMGLHEPCLRLLKQSRARTEASGDEMGVRDIDGLIASAHFRVGRYGDALELMGRVIKGDEEHGQSLLALDLCVEFGRMLDAVGETAKALERLAQTVKKAKRASRHRVRAAANAARAEILWRAGERQPALDFNASALACYERIGGDVSRHVRALSLRASDASRRGNHESAHRDWQSAMDLAEVDGIRHIAVAPRVRLALCGVGNLEDALNSYRCSAGRMSMHDRVDLLKEVVNSTRDEEFRDELSSLRACIQGRLPVEYRTVRVPVFVSPTFA